MSELAIEEAGLMAQDGVDPEYLHKLDLISAGERLPDVQEPADIAAIRARKKEQEHRHALLVEEVRLNKPDSRALEDQKAESDETRERVETPEHIKVFEVWFNNRCSSIKTAKELNIGHRTLNRWREWFKWDDRAKKRWTIAAQIAEESGTRSHVKMVERHYEMAEKLLDRVEEFMDDASIDSYRDAIAATKIAVEIQRQCREMPNWVVSVKNASSDELKAQLRELLNARGRNPYGSFDSGAEGEGRVLGPGTGDDIIDVGFTAGETRQGLLEVSEGPDRLRNPGAELSSMVEAEGNSSSTS